MTEETGMATTRTEVNPGRTLALVLQDYSEIYLQCRGIQHRWNVIADLHIAEKLNEGELCEEIFQCENCDTYRKDRSLLRQDRWKVDRLERLDPVYKYPKDYLLSEMALVDHAREVLRHERLRRATTGKRRQRRAAS